MQHEMVSCDLCGRRFGDRAAVAYSVTLAGRGDGFTLADVCKGCVERLQRYLRGMVRSVEGKRILGAEPPVRRPAKKKK